MQTVIWYDYLPNGWLHWVMRACGCLLLPLTFCVWQSMLKVPAECCFSSSSLSVNQTDIRFKIWGYAASSPRDLCDLCDLCVVTIWKLWKMSLSVQQLTVRLFLFYFKSYGEIDTLDLFLRNMQLHNGLLLSGFY